MLKGLFGLAAAAALADALVNSVERVFERKPYHPPADEWGESYQMLCGHCDHQFGCPILEKMIEMEDIASWPEGGWVTDPGAGVTCLSYEPMARPPMIRQQLRSMMRQKEADLPPMCGGCAAQKGSEASVSLHTRRDYAAAVKGRSAFLCHEDPEHKRLCGGWCRAVRRRSAPP